jgi:hypothetical protein
MQYSSFLELWRNRFPTEIEIQLLVLRHAICVVAAQITTHNQCGANRYVAAEMLLKTATERNPKLHGTS